MTHVSDMFHAAPVLAAALVQFITVTAILLVVLNRVLVPDALQTTTAPIRATFLANRSAQTAIPAGTKSGHVLLMIVPVLTAAYRRNEWLSVPDVESELPTTTAGVRPALARLRNRYVPRIDADGNVVGYDPILASSDHETQRWSGRSGSELPVKTYKLSEAGYHWAVELLESMQRGPRARRSVLSRLYRFV